MVAADALTKQLASQQEDAKLAGQTAKATVASIKRAKTSFAAQMAAFKRFKANHQQQHSSSIAPLTATTATTEAAAEPDAAVEDASAKIPFKDDMWQALRSQQIAKLASMTNLSSQMAALVVDRAASEAAHNRRDFT